MDLLVIVLRLLHVVIGALWIGFAVFTAFLLAPALQDTGLGGAGVMAALQRRGIHQVVSAFAGITVLTGIWLFWRVSGGFSPVFMGSHMGIALSVGGLAAIVGYAVGMTMVRPSMTRAATLSQELGSLTSENDRATMFAAIAEARGRGAAGARFMSLTLLLSAAAMAVARYL